MTELSVETLMDLLPQLFLPENARGMNVVINFDLTGEGGGDWNVIIHDQTCVAQPGKATPADLTLHARVKDILDIFTGKLDPTRALLFGKLKMSGEMRLAMKLAEIFNTNDPRLRQWRQ